MKILHLYKTYYPDTLGGCEEFIKILTQETEKLGCENYLLTTTAFSKSDLTRGDWEIYENLKIKRFKTTFELSSCPVSAAMLFQFKSYAERADILHLHHPWPYADLVYLMHAIKKPMLVTYHSDIIRQRFLTVFYQPVMKKILDHARAIVTTSENYLKTSPVLKNYQDKARVIPIGLDEKHYATHDPKTLVHWKTKVGTDFFLFIGVLRYYKGLHILIDAAKNSPFTVVIAGDGPLKQALEARIRNEKINNVVLLGSVTHQSKCALLHLCRAVVLPSHLRSEAFGISLLEGLLFGKPLISAELGTGTSYINQDHETGYVVPASDASALRHAMLCVQDGKISAEKIKKATRMHYEANFTAAKMGQQYYALYRDL